MAEITGMPVNKEFVGKYKFLDNNNQVLFSGNVITPPDYVLDEFNVTELAQQFVSPPDYDKILYGNERSVLSDLMTYDWENVYGIVHYGDEFPNIGSLSNSDIKVVWLPSTLESTGDVFQDCTTLKRVYCWGCTEIGMSAFNGCTNLTTFIMYETEDDEITINEYAFDGCENLEEIWLSENVVYIENHAFDGCRLLNRIYLPGSRIPELASNTIFSDTVLEAIYVDEYMVEEFKADPSWSAFSNIIFALQDSVPTPMYSYYNMQNKLLYETVSGNIIMPDGGYFNNDYWGRIISNGYLHNEFVHRFTLQTVEHDLQYYYIWDYSDTNEYGSNNFHLIRSWGVQDYVFPNQRIPFVVYNRGQNNNRYYYLQGNRSYYVSDLYNGYITNSYATTFLVDPDKEASTASIKLSDGMNGIPIQTYKIDWCHSDNARTLYFINENGGLSWCQFNCRNIEVVNATRNQIENNGIHNYLIQTHNEYTLNTDWLNDEQYRKIIQLFKSPKVWMHDYRTNKISNVVITDKSLTVKNRLNDKNYNYTIKCKDVNTENIFIS